MTKSIKDIKIVGLIPVRLNSSRLFRKEGNRYIKVSDDFRGTYVSTNKQLDSFINNTNSSAVTDDNKERQYLSKVVKPKVD